MSIRTQPKQKEAYQIVRHFYVDVYEFEEEGLMGMVVNPQGVANESIDIDEKTLKKIIQLLQQKNYLL